jgi:hypothetical protein
MGDDSSVFPCGKAMIFLSPTLDFCVRSVDLQWSDVVWGIENGIFTWKDVRNFALHRMTDPRSTTFDIENSIASLDKNEASEMMDLARDAASNASPVTTRQEQERWLFLLLKWAYENRSSIPYPLGVVDELYAEFGYPENMESFVAFLPPKDGWEPMKHTATENENRLLTNWETYLKNSPFTLQIQ